MAWFKSFEDWNSQFNGVNWFYWTSEEIFTGYKRCIKFLNIDIVDNIKDFRTDDLVKEYALPVRCLKD